MGLYSKVAIRSFITNMALLDKDKMDIFLIMRTPGLKTQGKILSQILHIDWLTSMEINYWPIKKYGDSVNFLWLHCRFLRDERRLDSADFSSANGAGVLFP